MEEAEIFPAHQLFKKMGAYGFLGLCKPREYGGMGLDYSDSLVMAETLGYIHCGGVPMAIGGGADEVMMGIIAKTMGIHPGKQYR